MPELCKALDIENVFVKDETFNRFGTMKDRRSKVLVKVAKEIGLKKIFCVSSGNLGKSLSEFCAENGLECTVVLPKNLPKSTLKKISRKSKVILTENLHKKFSIWSAEKIMDSFPDSLDGTSNNPLSIVGYISIVKELFPLRPDYIVVPLGQGELFCGLCHGIKELGLQTRVVGVSVKGKNPIAFALVKNSDEEVVKEKFEENLFDKMVSFYTPLLPIIMHYLRNGHLFIELPEDEAKKAVFEFQPFFEHSIEPSSLSVFSALTRLPIRTKKEKIVCVLTGRNHTGNVLRHKA